MSGDELEVLYRKAAAQVDEDNPIYRVRAVMQLLAELLPDGDSIDRQENKAAAGIVIAEIAAEHGVAAEAIEYVEDNAPEMAQRLGIGGVTGSSIVDGVAPPVREVHREQTQPEIGDDSDGTLRYTLNHAVGLDEYVESQLSRVLKVNTEDRKADPTIIFEFGDGTTLEFDDSTYRNKKMFAEEIGRATSEQVVTKVASVQAAEDTSGDPWDDDYAEEEYRELSLGPSDRPWGLDWEEVITNLTSGKNVKEITDLAGPNTDAWEDLQARIRNARAAHNRQSVVDAGNGAIHYNEDHDELWIPTGMIDDAIEDYATKRESFVYELDARGVTSDEVSGVSCSYSDYDVDPWSRWWRLDASHPDVPNPNTIVPEIETSQSAYATPDSTGGTTAYGGDGE